MNTPGIARVILRADLVQHYIYGPVDSYNEPRPAGEERYPLPEVEDHWSLYDGDQSPLPDNAPERGMWRPTEKQAWLWLPGDPDVHYGTERGVVYRIRCVGDQFVAEVLLELGGLLPRRVSRVKVFPLSKDDLAEAVSYSSAEPSFDLAREEALRAIVPLVSSPLTPGPKGAAR